MTHGFVGQPLKRLEDPRLLRGEGAFLDDLRLPGVHHVAFVRSIHAHARFRVDPSAALALPGVVGGFGVKQDIYPEELGLAVLAMRLRVPVKWIETRREHLTATARAREQWADVQLAALRDGSIVALSVELLADMGPIRGASACCVPRSARRS